MDDVFELMYSLRLQDGGGETMRSEPVSVHSIRLMNGITIEIEMHYDKKKLSLLNLSEILLIDDLDELRLSFESQQREKTCFVLQSEHCNVVWQSDREDRESRWANFRLGPILKEMMGGGEGRIYSQIRGRASEEKEAMRVRVGVLDQESLMECSSRVQLLHAQMKSVRLCDFGSRGVIVEGVKGSVSAEILSLWSPYFLALFYGGFKEREHTWIRLQDVLFFDWILLSICIRDRPSALRKTGLYIESNKLLQLLQLLDRFDLQQHMTVFKERLLLMVQIACSYDEISFDFVVAVAEVLHSDEILVKFFDKFIDMSSMDEYVEKWNEWMTPEIERIVQQKRKQLEGVHRSTMKLRIVGGGSIVVSLLSDIHPRAVTALFGDMQGARSQAGRHVLELTTGRIDTTENRRPFLPSGANCILVADSASSRPHIEFCSNPSVQQLQQLMVLGIVTKGAEYANGEVDAMMIRP